MTENIYKLAIPLIKKFEGFVPNPYYCSAMKLTIGYGERVDLRPNKKYGNIYGCQLTQACNDILAKVGGNAKKANILIAKQYPNIITEQEASAFLIEVLRNDYWGQIGKDLPHGLNDKQIASIISLAYNIGVANFKASTMFKLLQAGKIDKAGLEFKKWVFAGGKKLKGLENRRKDEQDLYFS